MIHVYHVGRELTRKFHSCHASSRPERAVARSGRALETNWMQIEVYDFPLILVHLKGIFPQFFHFSNFFLDLWEYFFSKSY